MKTPPGSNVAGVEAQRPTASILAFPGRAAPVAPGRDDRLAQALLSLNDAMQHQRAAIAAWRDALHTLKASNEGLSLSLQRYQSSLKSLSAKVSGLQRTARALEAWADGAASGSGATG